MANVMIKYLKFAQIINRRLSFSSVKHYPRQHLFRSYTNSKFGKNYATAAYKLAINGDSGMRNNDVGTSSDLTDIQSIDTALAKIDSVIKRNGRTQMKNIHKIFSSITSNEVTSSLHGLYLLRGCKYCIDEPPSKRIKMVNEIWNRYQELGIEFDVRHFNAMLDVHVKNNLDFNPVEILASMEDLKIDPNKDTYMLIMKKYCQEGNIAGASEILEYMKEKQMPADEKVFNYLIEAHINNNDIAGAKEMMEVMRSSNLEPTTDTHAIFACGYAASGDKEEMISHLMKCKSEDNIKNYLKVIEALASSGNHHYIDDVLSLIEHKEWHQQEFINCAVELVHKNFIDVAYKLVTLSCTPDYNEGANIFMKQLVKVGGELPEIIKYCEQIQKDGLNQNIYFIAARSLVDIGKLDHIVPLFKEIEKLGFYVRPSSFWTLFSSLKESEQFEGYWLILKSMSDLGIPCDFRTYSDIIYPALGAPEPDEVIKGIKQSGQAIDTAVDALFVYYCHIGELDYALKLVEDFPVTINNRFDVESFLRLYQEIDTESTGKYFKLLKFILKQDSDFGGKCEVQGKLLTELILNKNRLLQIILNKFEDLTFSDYTLSICETELSARNPARVEYLKKIKALKAERENIMMHENLSVEDEDKHISRLQAQKISCGPFLVKRILHHIKNKNIPRLQQLLMLHDELKLEQTPLMLSNLFGLWCVAADIEKAKETLDKLNTNFPSFHVDVPKILDYASLLMKYERFDESYETLKECLEKPTLYYTSKDSLMRSINRFNLTLSSTRNHEFVKKMQNVLLPLSKELESVKPLLDPVVNMHLLKNDLKSALEEFRNIAVTHRVPVCLNQFLRKCISANEKDILQKVVDLTINCNGKSYALLELAVAFIETFDVQNAAKVIESLGREADPKVLDSLFVKLRQQNKLNELESLLQITKSLNHVDRENLYCHAFRACVSRNHFQRALQLFDKMKAEGIEPSNETMRLLQDVLKKNNQPLPLSLVSKSATEISPVAIEATKTFHEHLNAGSSEAALKELSTLKKGYVRTLSIKNLTDLVDLCLQNNRVHELAQNVNAMSYILENVRDVFKPIIEKYSEAGDVEKFTLVTSFMPDFSLMNIGFNTYFCKAFINSGKYDELLSSLEERVSQKNKLFSTVAFEELLKLPQYEERIFNLAVKYLDSNYNLPMSVLWAHYFCKENYDKANEIHKNFPVSAERVDNIILRNIKKSENIDVAKKFIDFLKESSVRARVKERAYGAALDLLVFKGMYDEAANMVVDSEKQNLQLHKYYLSTLVTLKSALEKENKPVPFTIPLDTASGSSSDSD